MSGLLASFAWCSLQVTLVALLAWLLCALARRMSASHAAALPATALAAVIVLTALAFVPWPAGWSYGPVLNWQETIPNADKESASVENVISLEQSPPLTPELRTEPTVVIPAEEADHPENGSTAVSLPAIAPPVSTPPEMTPSPASSPALPRAFVEPHLAAAGPTLLSGVDLVASLHDWVR